MLTPYFNIKKNNFLLFAVLTLLPFRFSRATHISERALLWGVLGAAVVGRGGGQDEGVGGAAEELGEARAL